LHLLKVVTTFDLFLDTGTIIKVSRHLLESVIGQPDNVELPDNLVITDNNEQGEEVISKA